MNKLALNTWQEVQAEVLDRIQSRYWNPGEIIPAEADLAEEFGCARATVNRALRAVAENGLLDRKRKAGTRVTVNPVRKATLNIAIIRQEIESKNQLYSYALIDCENKLPPVDIGAKMQMPSGTKALRITALHMADGKPYVFEDRWINLGTVPDAAHVDFAVVSANEWLVAHAPFTQGDIAFSARQASAALAELMGTEPGAALFLMERNTWDGDQSITSVQLTFHPNYRMHTFM